LALQAAMLAWLAGAAFSQEGADSASADGTQRVDHCVTAPAILDVNVLTDDVVYVRTRGNHYVLMTAECPGFVDSYRRMEGRLVPYGSSVCQGDGSYFIYLQNRSERACPILTIDRVADRAEALLIASGRGDVVDVEKADPPP
jgi:hypothetical protein